MKASICFLVGMLALACTAGGAAAVHVTVDARHPQWQISKYLTGMHFVYADEPDSLYRDERIADWMRRAGVGIIRWPGGTAVQTYHWDHLNGIAFQEDSWDPQYHAQAAFPENYMDLDEYVAFCRRVGAEPMVGVNTGSGKRFNRLNDSLDEARRLIAYCKQKGYGVKHWYIGNECYKGWGAKGYAELIDRYAAQLRAVDPNIIIIGDWKFGPERKHRFDELLTIAESSRQLNVIEVHEKWGNEFGLSDNDGEATLANWQQQAGIYHGRLTAYIAKFLQEMKGAGKNVRLAFNEWGAAMGGDATPFHVALVKADYLVAMFQYPIYSACDWNLNMGPGKSRILLTSEGGHKLEGFSPAALVFEMCAPALQQRSFSCSSSDRLVYGFAASGKAPGDVQIWLLNKRSEAVAVELKITGLVGTHTRHKVESFVEPGVIRRAEPQASAGGTATALRLDPLSFNHIEIF